MGTNFKPRFSPFSDYDIEKYLCGAASPELTGRLEAAARSSNALAKHLARRRTQQAQFYAVHPSLGEDVAPIRLAVAEPEPAPMVPRRRIGLLWDSLFGSGEQRKSEASRNGLQGWAPWLWAMSAAAVCGGFALFGVFGTEAVPSQPTIRARGALKAALVVKRGETVFQYDNRSGLRPGDHVRIALESPQQGYVSVFGRDAAGRVAKHYDNVPIGRGRSVLPDSLILDDDPNPEQWHVVFSRRPHRVESLQGALISATQGDDSPVEGSTVIHLEKEAIP